VVTHLVGEVQGKIAVVVDDMISTGGTLVKAAEALMNKGATDVYTLATHGIFAGDAVKQFANSPIRRVIVTDTIPLNASLDGDDGKIEQQSIAQILADAIKRITSNRSVSELFGPEELENPDHPGVALAVAAAAAETVLTTATV